MKGDIYMLLNHAKIFNCGEHRPKPVANSVVAMLRRDQEILRQTKCAVFQEKVKYCFENQIFTSKTRLAKTLTRA